MDLLELVDLIERHHLRFHYPVLQLRGIRFRAVAGCACGLEFRLLATPLRAWAEHVGEVLLFALEANASARAAETARSSEARSPR